MTAVKHRFQDSPFELHNHAAYEAWRTRKLQGCPQHAQDLIVKIDGPGALTQAEREAILERVAKNKHPR